jgi:hypothetical protein
MKYPKRGRPQVRPETGTHKVFVQGYIEHLSFGSSKHSHERKEHYKGIPQWHFRYVFRLVVTNPDTGEQEPSRMFLTMPYPLSNNVKSHSYTFLQNNHFPPSIEDPFQIVVGKTLEIGYRNLSNAGSWQFGSSKLLLQEEPSEVFDSCVEFTWVQGKNELDELPPEIRSQLESEILEPTDDQQILNKDEEDGNDF